jgi:hypothetical protein
MEDSRRPFTPLIPQGGIETPERSLSPTGRATSKTSKGTADTSGSPNRKTKETSASSTSKKETTKKDTKKGGAKESGTTTSGSKESGGRKANRPNAAEKSEKTSLGDPLEETLTKQSLFLEASSKLIQYDQNEVNATSILPLRSESQAQMRAESALSFAPSTIAETGYVPFSVEPAFGRCEAGKTIMCKVF